MDLAWIHVVLHNMDPLRRLTWTDMDHLGGYKPDMVDNESVIQGWVLLFCFRDR